MRLPLNAIALGSTTTTSAPAVCVSIVAVASPGCGGVTKRET